MMIIITFRNGPYCFQWNLDFILLFMVLLLHAVLCSFINVRFSVLL